MERNRIKCDIFRESISQIDSIPIPATRPLNLDEFMDLLNHSS